MNREEKRRVRELPETYSKAQKKTDKTREKEEK